MHCQNKEKIETVTQFQESRPTLKPWNERKKTKGGQIEEEMDEKLRKPNRKETGNKKKKKMGEN